MTDGFSRRYRFRASNIGLAVMVLALVGAGLYAVFGEFATSTWRSAHGAGKPASRASGRPDLLASGKPDVLASGKPDVLASGEPDVLASGGPDGSHGADLSGVQRPRPMRSGAARHTWRGLVVAPEYRCAPYDRKDYFYPQSVEAQIVAAMGGRIYGPYTGRTFVRTGHTDIEHMVATSEAHDSGLCAADAATRSTFARDLLNLTLAAPEVNRCGKRGKCGKDAGEWLPARNDCWFAARVILVKRRYGLSVDRREAQALEQVLSNCSSTDLVFHDSAAWQPDGRLSRRSWDDNQNGRISRSDGNGGACRGFTGHSSGFHDGVVTSHHERHGRGGHEGFRPAMCSGMIDTFEGFNADGWLTVPTGRLT